MAIEELLGQLTLEEKCSLLSGSAFWYTQAVERLGIRKLMLTDGPHGLRKQVENADHLGLNKSVPAPCFPPAAALAASWNEELIYEMGEALGIECRAENVDVLLGPGANIKRSPLCGRNFEYFSEDPYLSSRLAKAHITGLQSKGVGASIKHFAANNQETRRLTINAKVDERTLREIYLASFETAIKEGKPWTVMCAYNRLNGEFGSENKKVLNDVLRDEWAYEGLVVTDWGATNDRVKGLEAGQDLEMPSSGGVNDRAVLEAVQEGKITEAQVDVSVRRLLELIAKADEKPPVEPFVPKTHHELAQKIASECIVLLKNEEQQLPLAKTEKIALIGEFAVKSRIQGGGSSHINPTFLDTLLEEMQKRGGDAVLYEKGFSVDAESLDEAELERAIAAAKAADKVVLCMGLPESYETEGLDRKHLNLPGAQLEMIRVLKQYNPRVKYRERDYAPEQIFGDAAEGWDFPYSLEEVISAFFENMNLTPLIYPETIPVLRKLRSAGWKIATLTDVATGMPDKLHKSYFPELMPYFDMYVSSQSCGFRKPNPEGVHQIAEHFQADEKEFIFVGDEPKDIKTAQNVGCRSVLIDRKGRGIEAGQDYTITTLDELLPICRVT